MSGSHDKLPKLFWIQLILVALVGLGFIFAPKAIKHVAEASTEAHTKNSINSKSFGP